jgi:hypothetical protein
MAVWQFVSPISLPAPFHPVRLPTPPSPLHPCHPCALPRPWLRVGIAIQIPGDAVPRAFYVRLGTLPCDLPAGASLSASVGVNAMCLRCLFRPKSGIDGEEAQVNLMLPALCVCCLCAFSHHVPTARAWVVLTPKCVAVVADVTFVTVCTNRCALGGSLARPDGG